MSVSRRDFLRSAAVVGVVPTLIDPRGDLPRAWDSRLAPRAGGSFGSALWPGYGDAVVIDFLGSPGYFNYPENPPLDEEMVANATHSGITAMNVTVSSGDTASTLREMAPWFANVERWPAVFRMALTRTSTSRR